MSVIAFGTFFWLAHPGLAAKAVSIMGERSSMAALIDLPGRPSLRILHLTGTFHDDEVILISIWLSGT